MIGAISPQSRPDLTALGSAIGWIRSTEHLAEALELLDQLSQGHAASCGPPARSVTRDPSLLICPNTAE